MSINDHADSPIVRIDRADCHAEIVINRPHRRNALSPASMTALAAAFQEVDSDDDIRAVILRGEEGFFCSGVDLAEMDPSKGPPTEWIKVHRALAALDKPIICALQGGAINAGSALALACDLMVAGENAYVQVKEAEMGMAPPINAAWLALRYPTNVGLQLTLSCRRFAGPDLIRLAIALECVPDADVLGRARALADHLAGFPKNAAAVTKRVLRGSRNDDVDKFNEAVEAAFAAQDNSRTSNSRGM